MTESKADELSIFDEDTGHIFFLLRMIIMKLLQKDGIKWYKCCSDCFSTLLEKMSEKTINYVNTWVRVQFGKKMHGNRQVVARG